MYLLLPFSMTSFFLHQKYLSLNCIKTKVRRSLNFHICHHSCYVRLGHTYPHHYFNPRGEQSTACFIFTLKNKKQNITEIGSIQYNGISLTENYFLEKSTFQSILSQRRKTENSSTLLKIPFLLMFISGQSICLR